MRRKSSNPELNFWTGHLDGPPIGACEISDRLKRNAIAGSQRLASRIAALELVP